MIPDGRSGRAAIPCPKFVALAPHELLGSPCHGPDHAREDKAVEAVHGPPVGVAKRAVRFVEGGLLDARSVRILSHLELQPGVAG